MGRVIKKEDLRDVPLSVTRGDRELLVVLGQQYWKTRYVENVKSGLMEVAVKMAEQIVGDIVDASPETLQKKYADALSEVAVLAPGTIRLHSAGAARAEIRELAARFGFTVTVDDTLNKADCIVETEDVTLDATTETALYHFRKILQGSFVP